MGGGNVGGSDGGRGRGDGEGEAGRQAVGGGWRGVRPGRGDERAAWRQAGRQAGRVAGRPGGGRKGSEGRFQDKNRSARRRHKKPPPEAPWPPLLRRTRAHARVRPLRRARPGRLACADARAPSPSHLDVAELADLVVHERDERGHHQAEAGAGQRRELVRERFAACAAPAGLGRRRPQPPNPPPHSPPAAIHPNASQGCSIGRALLTIAPKIARLAHRHRAPLLRLSRATSGLARRTAT